MTQEIVEVAPPSRWAARGVAGPIRPDAGVVVEPLDDGRRSRVTFELASRGHGIGIPLLPAVRRMAAKGAPLSYRRLKERLDQAASEVKSGDVVYEVDPSCLMCQAVRACRSGSLTSSATTVSTA
jgi:transposase InsO family protein